MHFFFTIERILGEIQGRSMLMSEVVERLNLTSIVTIAVLTINIYHPECNNVPANLFEPLRDL